MRQRWRQQYCWFLMCRSKNLICVRICCSYSSGAFFRVDMCPSRDRFQRINHTLGVLLHPGWIWLCRRFPWLSDDLRCFIASHGFSSSSFTWTCPPPCIFFHCHCGNVISILFKVSIIQGPVANIRISFYTYTSPFTWTNADHLLGLLLQAKCKTLFQKKR